MRHFFLIIALVFSALVNAQVSSNKGGDIILGEKQLVNMEKFDGSAATKPKFRLININNDTLVTVNFNKDFDFDWMRFNFKKLNKIVEVNTGEIISGLNYKKNLGSFFVKNNLIDTSGNISDTAFAIFIKKYPENLTVKYRTLNEGNRLVVSTKFEFSCEDNKIFVNDNHVGFANVPDNEQVEFKNISFVDLQNNVIARGDLGFFAGNFLKTYDNKLVNVGRPSKTTNCSEKKVFVTSILRELFRNGYFRNKNN
jgi:hypothetical protein